MGHSVAQVCTLPRSPRPHAHYLVTGQSNHTREHGVISSAQLRRWMRSMNGPPEPRKGAAARRLTAGVNGARPIPNGDCAAAPLCRSSNRSTFAPAHRDRARSRPHLGCCLSRIRAACRGLNARVAYSSSRRMRQVAVRNGACRTALTSHLQPPVSSRARIARHSTTGPAEVRP